MARGLASTDQVRADFDAIASLPGPHTWRNERYLGWLLRQVPAPCTAALDAGCGAGTFTRMLASRAARVHGIDLSPHMIAAAARASRGVPNVTFEVADVMARPAEPERYDVVASVATLHHLPLAAALHRLGDALRPGGTLLVLDLLDTSGLRELPRNGIAWLVDRSRRLAAGWPRPGADARRAWELHAAHDRYDTWADLQRTYAAVLPGATLRRHLLWRYSAVWRKPRNG